MNNEPTKTQKAMKTIKFLSIAALALVGAVMTGCSSDDDIFNNQQQPVNSKNIVTVNTSISLDNIGDDSGDNDGNTTRALSYNMAGTKLVKFFKEGDQIAVIYKNTNGETVKATSVELKKEDITNDDKTANFTVTLENPKAGTVEYVYPAPMANDDGTEASILSQDGTKATLERNFDYARGSGTMTQAGSTFTLPSVSLTNRFAICTFYIKDIDNVSTLNDVFSQLTISDGTNTYTIAPSGGGNFSNGMIYVAMKPVTAALKATITNGTHTFEKTLTNRTYAANNVYQISMSYSVKCINKSSASIPNNATWLIIGTGEATSNAITIGAGATANLWNVNISAGGSAIACSGNATINLAEGTTNRANGTCGIRIGGSGTTLTINGPGTLYAQSGEYGAAGIGGTDKAAVGNIVINGGEIHATGGYYAAGIGSGHGTGDGYAEPGSCGTITIHGGTVEARGGYGGAGIGAGAGRSSYSSITIDGGNVSAYGGTSYGAGIGSGGSNTSAGPITISGASTVVNATGATWGAGIGSGDSSPCGNIKISGGNITANAGEYGAGIGCGSSASCGDILINGGTIRAWYYDPYDMRNFFADGIGTADGSKCGNITITSDVTEVRTNSAIGGEHVPVGGDYDYCEGTHGTVTVDWSKVIRDWPSE